MVMKKTKPQSQIIPTNSGIFQIDKKEVDKYLKKIKRPSINIVFFGSDSWSIHVLKVLEENFEVAAVVTTPNSAVSNYNSSKARISSSAYFKGLVLTRV
jgi:hypothetical protein